MKALKFYEKLPNKIQDDLDILTFAEKSRVKQHVKDLLHAINTRTVIFKG